MNLTNSGRRRRPFALLAATLVAIVSLGGFATGVAADATDTSTVNQMKDEIRGTANGIGASAGVAKTYDIAKVHQMNIQVIAGDQETKENSTQNATNDATINQYDAAVSGDATSDGTSTATSGNATAGSVAIVHQMNIQVIAGRGCHVTQDASNTAVVDQEAIAATGEAQASDDSSASSGDASARNKAMVKQKNVQVYVCRNGATGEQVAANAASIAQAAGAASGAATATDDSTAQTGDAGAVSREDLKQTNVQVAR